MSSLASSSSQGVIEISVEETNRLRAELGLPPLRRSASAATATNTTAAAAAAAAGRAEENALDLKKSLAMDPSKIANAESNEVLTLSVAETNELRQRLGMAPLQVTSHPSGTANSGSSTSTTGIQHAPAVNLMHVQQAAERVEHAKLQRLVQDNIRHQFATPSLGTTATTTIQQPFAAKPDTTSHSRNNNSTRSWAQQMRAQPPNPPRFHPNVPSVNPKGLLPPQPHAAKYDETDLQGLSVGHSVADLPEGSTTVLTLVDVPLLTQQQQQQRSDLSYKVQAWNDDDDDALQQQEQPRLENVLLAERQSQRDGWIAKRRVEHGRGRAGGYSGGDDDEFAELGGTQAPSRTARRYPTELNGTDRAPPQPMRGFTIGTSSDTNRHEEPEARSDLWTTTTTHNNAYTAPGRAISLEPTYADVPASDFMTVAEQKEEEKAIALAAAKKKKEGKFKKEKKMKKAKKKSKRRTAESDEEDADEDAPPVMTKGLLEELEETAVDTALSRKRRRADAGGADEMDGPNGREEAIEPMDQKRSIVGQPMLMNKSNRSSSKRSRYDQVMAKGNERSLLVFGSKKKPSAAAAMMDEEPDDAFLNAALAKARRLVRLKELSEASKTHTGGADAVVAAIQQSKMAAAAGKNESTATTTGTITFAVDETLEFTRALMARKTEQTERELARKKVAKSSPDEHVVDAMDVDGKQEEKAKVAVVQLEEPEEQEDVDIVELAKQVREDDNGLDGATGQTLPIGRGLGGILNLLKQSGEITRKNAGKEEMRGRAKDKRTYEDYEPLDLSKVVTIDESKATGKDKEFAHREIKLEYRDKHGRLLTRKEAFRELSYQFHGYGSGKRKEEKKLEQIAREQAEARLASRQAAEGAGAGTFGALKATQKATGKAFVVHKTGN